MISTAFIWNLSKGYLPFDVLRVYESNIKRNSSEQKSIHYVIYRFTLTILPILIAMSIRDYYDEKFYEYKNGYFKYYYTVQLTSFGELDFKAIQEVTGTSFKNSSVITNNMRMGIPGIGEVTMVGLINKIGLRL